jgi:pyruvate/2-oxoglutarate dehydrogenase complex dihydrolipoamide dehydrogenase (E3) component
VSDFDYDVIVIGCGSAGSKAAATVQGLGGRVLAVDPAEELGGLCILRGCMPTKTLLETTHRLHEIKDAARFGISVGAPELDFAAVMERMRQLRARFQRAKVGSIERAGYELRRARARFVDPHTVELEGQSLRAKAYVLATGSVVRPLGVPVPDGVDVKTSDDMFQLEAVPKRALVLGAGAVGLEFAQWLARIGAETTLSTRSHLLHRTDLALGEELRAALSEEMRVIAPARLAAVETAPGGAIRVRLEPAEGAPVEVETDLLLNATGRVAAFDGLGLDQAGLDAAALRPGPTLQAPVEHVFVAGDASRRRQILHEANLEGAIAGRNAARMAGLLEGDIEAYDAGIPPVEVIFTDPPVANVGLSPQVCEARGIACREAIKKFPQQGRGIVMGASHGWVRLVTDPGSGRVLGCQMIGARADDLIHIPATVMSLGGTVQQMFEVPWYHPTLAEAFIELCRELSG